MTQINRLRRKEKELVRAGQWEHADLLQYTRELLSALDDEFFPSGYLEKILEIAELERHSIRNERVAVLCKSHQGIYSVEAELRKRYEKQIGVIVLDQGDGHFTLRQADPFLPKNLSELYLLLNERDPNVQDATSEKNRWGGASDIGGSPRETGSGLSGHDVMQAVLRLFGDGGWLKKLVRRLSS